MAGGSSGSNNTENNQQNQGRTVAGISYNLAPEQRLQGSSNYKLWKYYMTGLFVNEGLWKCVLGTDTDPDRCLRAYYRFAPNVSPTVVPVIMNLNCPRLAWNLLETNYGKTSETGKLELYKHMFSISLDNYDTMQDYLNDILCTQAKLTSMEAGLDDKVLACVMLIGLPPQYEPIKLTLEGSKDPLTSDVVLSKLTNYKPASSNSESAHFVKNRGNSQKNSNGGNGKSKHGESSKSGRKFERRDCFFCKASGHLKKDCEKYKKWLTKQQAKANKAEEEEEVAATAIAIEDFMEDSDFGTSSPAEDLDSDCCSLTVAEDHQEKALAVESEHEVTWLVDSGATKHMCSDPTYFESISESSSTRSVKVANGRSVPCAGVGDVILQVPGKSVRAKDVLFVPELNANLLSVSAMVDHDLDINFNKRGCFVRNDKGVEVMKGKRRGGLFLVKYKLQHDRKPESIPVVTFNVTCEQDLWHKRLGHLSVGQMKQLKGKVAGFEVDSVDSHSCETCFKGKICRKPFPKGESERSKAPLDLVHADLMGPMKVSTFGNSKFVLLLVDDFSRKLFAFLLPKKSDAVQKIKEFVVTAETQTERRLKIFRSDNGKEFCQQNLDGFLTQRGVIHQTTAPYTPEQNGVAERNNRTVVEMARCMLFESKLSEKFWGEALLCAVYVRNRCPAAATNGNIPQELWSGKKCSIDHFKVFGCQAYVQIPKEKRTKWDAKAVKLLFVGYSETTKAYRFVDPLNPSKVLFSRNAEFMERHTPPELPPVNYDLEKIQTLIYVEDQPERPLADEQHNEEQPVEEEEHYEEDLNEEEQHEDQNFKDSDRRYPLRDRKKRLDPDMIYDFSASKSRRSKEEELYLCAIETIHPEDPLTVEEALSRPDAEKWRGAIQEEIASMKKNDVWDEVNRPEDKQVLSVKWVLKSKFDADGKFVKAKARLVARGFSQKYGDSYEDTFSPTVRHANIRALFALAAKNGWHIHHVDVTTAFLQGKLKEEVYIEMPCLDRSTRNGLKVCKLKRAIYGLKQASRSWYDTLHAALAEMGFQRSQIESCIYFKKMEGLVIVLAVYVDDIIIFCSSLITIEKFKVDFGAKFLIIDLGRIHSYLGVRVQMKDGNIYLDQETYAGSIIKKFGMSDCVPVATPMETGLCLVKGTSEPDRKQPYQKLLGCLLYLAVFTRPDLMHAVSVLSQFNTCYTNAHWGVLKRVVKYLQGTSHYSLRYTKKGDLVGFSDATWGSCHIDRKSYTGYVMLLGDGAISWQSRKQGKTALSSAEAEYVALSECAKEAIAVSNLVGELQKPITMIPVGCDNQSTIALAREEKASKSLRHVDIRYHFVKECVEKGPLRLHFVPTKSMVADVLTKPLTTEQHQACIVKMGVAS